MAAKRPAAVAMSASAMPGATTARSVEPWAPMFEKADMMPQTVPNRPMNGVMLAVVARNVTRFSSLLTSADEARSNARSTAARLFKVGRGAGAARTDRSALAGGAAAFSSAYPAWNMPTSGLCASELHTACTSENFALRPEDVEKRVRSDRRSSGMRPALYER